MSWSRIRNITLIVASAGLLTSGCSGGEELNTQPVVLSQPAADGQGFVVPDCTGVAADSCVASNFVPSRDGFSFKNWGSPGLLSATELVTLFGEDVVCAELEADSCVLYPAAQQWADQVNEAIVGGRCEGMAVVAQRLFANPKVLGKLDKNATSTFDIKQSESVVRALDLWYSTQMLIPVQEAFLAYHDSSPTDLAQDLMDGLRNGTNFTLALYSEQGGGHTITPIAVAFDGNTYAISVYDNNYPSLIQEVLIDASTQTWSYEPSGWKGGVGGMDLTPMIVRKLPGEVPFSTSENTVEMKGSSNDAMTTVMMTSPMPNVRVGMTLTIDGRDFSVTDTRSELPVGVVARPLLNGTDSANGLVLLVDRGAVPNFDIEGLVLASTDLTPKNNGDFTLSIEAPGDSRLVVRARTLTSAKGIATIQARQDRGVSVTSSAGKSVQAVVTQGRKSLSALIPAGGQLDVTLGSQNEQLGINFTEGPNSPNMVLDFAGPLMSKDVTNTVVQKDPGTGRIQLTTTAHPALSIDWDSVRALRIQ
jgi:hypothetical protein